MDAITIKDVHISYKTVKARSIKKSLFSLRKASLEKFEAVKGISFSIEQGEIVGLIGKNGSGKSTLLRSVANVFAPDSGTIDLHGNSVSLLSIGVGFQNDLTGKENIYLSGLLMGFTEQEIDEKYDEIVEFSELGDFIYSPVKTYSSGMYSKLAFSITAVLETDILLVDETLSVGDTRFKRKSFNKMKELISHENRTVVIVSHNAGTIRKLCTKAVWIDEGVLMDVGPANEILEKYENYMNSLDSIEEQKRRLERKKKIAKRRIKKAKKLLAQANEGLQNVQQQESVGTSDSKENSNFENNDKGNKQEVIIEENTRA